MGELKKKEKKSLSSGSESKSTTLQLSYDAPADGEKKPKKKKKKTLAGALVKKEKLEKAIKSELAEITLVPTANSQEQEQLEEYMNMFRKLGKLIRKAEKQCMKSGQSRDYYALCTLMSQQREVISDIRSVTDMSSQVAAIENDVLQPLIRSIGQNTLDVFYQLKKLIVSVSIPKETQFALAKLSEITKEQGTHMHVQYGNALEKVNKMLMG